MGSSPSHTNQSRMSYSLNSIQFTLPIPKNNRNRMPQPYDPVPPYDLDDIEANAESYHHPRTQPHTTSNSPNDVDGQREEDSNVVDPSSRRKQRPVRMTQKECCDYSFLYLKTVVVGVVAITFFISLFNYLGRRQC
jgi:hypothetical protein